MRVGHLPHEAGLPDAWLPDHRDNLAMAAGRPAERLADLLQFALSPDEAGETASGPGVQARAARPRPDQVVHVDRRVHPLHAHRPERLDLDVPLDEPQRVGGEEAAATGRQLLHPGGQVGGLAHGGVIHVEVGADGAHDDLARVEPDADLDGDAVGAAGLFGIASDGGLHIEGGITRPDGVILVRQGRAEERHDPVTHHLVDHAFVTMDGLHHPLKHRIEQLARLLGIAVGQQFHRALEIGEEDGHLLALALEGALRGEDLLGEVLRGVGVGRGRPRHGANWLERLPTAPAELPARRHGGRAGGAHLVQPAAAVFAEADGLAILEPAVRAAHHRSSVS